MLGIDRAAAAVEVRQRTCDTLIFATSGVHFQHCLSRSAASGGHWFHAYRRRCAYDKRWVTAAALAAAYTHGLTTSPKHFDEPIRTALREIDQDRERLMRAAGVANDEWNSQREKIAKLHEDQSKTFGEHQATREKEFKDQFAEHKKQMERIQETFRKDTALKAAVTYFTEKAVAHETKTRAFALVALGVATVVVVFAFLIAKYVFGDKATPTAVEIGLIAICAFFILWLLRLLVRLLLSNLHLATDMRNRATLVQTYLALILEGGALKDTDRAMIVGLVFRPVSDGLVRDDGAPQTPFTIAQDFVSGGKPK